MSVCWIYCSSHSFFFELGGGGPPPANKNSPGGGGVPSPAQQFLTWGAWEREAKWHQLIEALQWVSNSLQESANSIRTCLRQDADHLGCSQWNIFDATENIEFRMNQYKSTYFDSKLKHKFCRKGENKVAPSHLAFSCGKNLGERGPMRSICPFFKGLLA